MTQIFRSKRAADRKRQSRPGQRAQIFLGRSFFYIVDGFVTSFIGVALSALIFGISLANINLWLLLLLFCAVLISITACGLGFFFGSLSLLTRDAWTILNTFWEALYILIGVNFPVSSLPAFLQPHSNGLPLTRGIMATHLEMDGGGWNTISGLIAGEVLVRRHFKKRKMVKKQSRLWQWGRSSGNTILSLD